MKNHSFVVLLVSFCPISLLLVSQTHSQPQTFIMKKIFSGKRLDGESLIYDARSKLDCGSTCLRNSCRSFGIDPVTLKCYLYVFHVWYGGKVAEVRNVTYYWLYQATCPTSYTFNQNLNLCYQYNANKVNWSEAMNHCIQGGGLLAIGNTLAKLNFFSQFASSNIFLGSTDIHSQREWKWFNGESIDGNWAPNQPDHGLVDDCITVDGTLHRLQDNTCVSPHVFMCEIKVYQN